jgi:murein DD-endopeptidase MepM/ murein hydrolase activator NlpD
LWENWLKQIVKETQPRMWKHGLGEFAGNRFGLLVLGVLMVFSMVLVFSPTNRGNATSLIESELPEASQADTTLRVEAPAPSGASPENDLSVEQSQLATSRGVPKVPEAPGIRTFATEAAKSLKKPATAMAAVAAPQSFHITLEKPALKQGEVTQILASNAPADLQALTIHVFGKGIRMYPVSKGVWLGLVPVDPLQAAGSYPLNVQDQNQAIRFQQTLTVTPGNFRTQAITVSKQTAGLEPEAGEMAAIENLKRSETPDRFWEVNLTPPVPDCMNSPFGVKRVVNGKFTGNYHKGVDQRSPQGRPIKAIGSGTVVIARKYQLHGGTVGLDHGQGLTSIYIHQSKIAVVPGQQVKQGDVIGYVGATGFAAGPHLHWGMYVHGVPINPRGFVGLSPCG